MACRDPRTWTPRLQQALSQGRLSAPPHIVDMEAQMKKEFVANVRKAKATIAKTGPGWKGLETDEVGKGKGKKRKQDDELESEGANKKTKITVKMGDLEFLIDQATIEAASTNKTATAKPKDPTTTSAKKTAAKDTPIVAEKSKKGVKAEAMDQGDDTAVRKAKTPKAKPQSKAEQAEKSPMKATKPKESAATKENAPKTPASKSKAEPNPKSEAKPKSEPKAKPELKVKKELSVKPAKATKKEPKTKGEPDVDGDEFMADAPPASDSARNVTGVYDIASDQLEEQLPEQANKLRCFLCVDNDSQPSPTWGGFELAMKSGVFRLAEDYAVPYVPLVFEWRSRDSQDGRLRFGKGCVGELQYVGRDEIRGVFHELFNEPLCFGGRRRPGPLWYGKPAWKFEQVWNGFVKEAYGR